MTQHQNPMICLHKSYIVLRPNNISQNNRYIYINIRKSRRMCPDLPCKGFHNLPGERAANLMKTFVSVGVRDNPSSNFTFQRAFNYVFSWFVFSFFHWWNMYVSLILLMSGYYQYNMFYSLWIVYFVRPTVLTFVAIILIILTNTYKFIKAMLRVVLISQ